MADVRKIYVVYICNFVSSKCRQIRFCENLQFGASLHHLSEIFIDDNMMRISLFSYGSSVIVRCMGVHNPPDRIPRTESPDKISPDRIPHPRTKSHLAVCLQFNCCKKVNIFIDAIISLGLALSPPSTSVSSDFMVLCRHFLIICLLHFTL